MTEEERTRIWKEHDVWYAERKQAAFEAMKYVHHTDIMEELNRRGYIAIITARREPETVKGGSELDDYIWRLQKFGKLLDEANGEIFEPDFNDLVELLQDVVNKRLNELYDAYSKYCDIPQDEFDELDDDNWPTYVIH